MHFVTCVRSEGSFSCPMRSHRHKPGYASQPGSTLRVEVLISMNDIDENMPENRNEEKFKEKRTILFSTHTKLEVVDET